MNTYYTYSSHWMLSGPGRWPYNYTTLKATFSLSQPTPPGQWPCTVSVAGPQEVQYRHLQYRLTVHSKPAAFRFTSQRCSFVLQTDSGAPPRPPDRLALASLLCDTVRTSSTVEGRVTTRVKTHDTNAGDNPTGGGRGRLRYLFPAGERQS